METYSLEEVRDHDSEESAWLVNKGRVFDVTEFISHHPGGRNVLLPKFGTDVSEIMQDPQIHKHTTNAYNMMNKYCIGKLTNQV
jgi:4-hydroxysphinganine ceramide fatty acyl 2-hydroxylase